MLTPDWIETALAEAARQGLARQLREAPLPGGQFVQDGQRILNFSSNDYLGFCRHPQVVARAREALDRYGAGSGASRLVAGTLPLHTELEQALALHKGYPAALVFGSGFLANAGIVTALAGRGDEIFADRLIHASLIDAAQLSGARLLRFRHNDPAHLADLLAKPASGRRLILTESVFSMDGDLAPLADYADLADRHGAMLMVDEAHATGVFGPSGAGRVAELGLQSRVDIAMGTLSKALGSYGGYAACSEPVRRLLIQRARSFIYTTAPAPASIGAALGALDVLREHPELGRQLLDRACRLRQPLQQAGLNTLGSASQIIPVVLGTNEATLAAMQQLRDQGLLAVAIRPPTVPAGSARLRLSVSLAHTEADIDKAVQLVREVCTEARQ